MAELTKPPAGPNRPDGGNKGHGPNDGHESGLGENRNIAWERRDISPFQITAFGIGLLIACMIVAVLMWGLFAFLKAREDAKNPPAMPAMMQELKTMKPPEPRLQANPRVEIQDLRESETAILENYGWLDPDKGTVRIPIEAAIDMVAKKGLPSKPTVAGTANDGYRTIPAVSNGGRTFEKITQ